MTGRVVPLEPDPHVAVQALLPWYVTGRLSPAETAHVDAHLPECAACRAELAAERQWQRLQPASVAQVDVEAGWSAMRARLGQGEPRANLDDAGTAAPSRARPARAFARHRPAGWSSAGLLLRWGWTLPTAAAAALALALGLHSAFTDAPGRGTVVAQAVPTPSPDASPAYRALAAPGAPTGAALVRFRDDATLSDVRAVLQRCEARIVDGPTAGAAFVVALPREHYVAALAALRRERAVTLAEALEPEGAR